MKAIKEFVANLFEYRNIKVDNLVNNKKLRNRDFLLHPIKTGDRLVTAQVWRGFKSEKAKTSDWKNKNKKLSSKFYKADPFRRAILTLVSISAITLAYGLYKDFKNKKGKAEAAQMAINKLRSSSSECSKSKNPEKCKKEINKAISKYERIIENNKDK